jgi:hypothetical protein
MTVQVAEAPADDTPPVLNHSTRCDRCGARAYVVVILKRSRKLRRGGELLFCAHDWRKNLEAIAPFVAMIVDETAQLFEHVKDDKYATPGKDGRP